MVHQAPGQDDRARRALSLVADENRTFVAANQTLADMLGYDSPAELMGLNGADMGYPGAEDTVAPVEARLQAGEIEKFTVERCYRRKDGSPLWIRVGVARI